MLNMVLAPLALCVVLLTTTSAYNYDYYRNFFNPSFSPSPYRRVDAGDDSYQADNYQPANSRIANERSIPYRTDVQRVQQERGNLRVADEMQPRNGNATYKFGNSGMKSFSSVPLVGSRRGGAVDSDSAVIFPGPTFRKSNFVPEIPKECEELGICEKVPNYPYEHVENLITQAGDLKYFNMDILTPEISQRRGSDHREVLCDSREEIIYPEAAKNIDGKWVYILNKKTVKVQGFKIEVCARPNTQCNPIAYVEQKYKLECGQKTTQRSMWSVNKDGYMVMEIVSTPSCCSCIIKDNKPPSPP